MDLSLTFLGTGDSKGVPRFWCDCAVCTQARTTGRNRRRRTALIVRGGGEVALLDAGTDLHTQLANLPRAVIPNAVFISHAHNDHLLGLADVLDYLAYAAGNIKIYAPASVIPQITERFGYAFRRAATVQAIPSAGIASAGFKIQLFAVPHGANGKSHGYLLARPGFRAALVTDAIGIPDELAAQWLGDLDLLVLGTSFVDESEVPSDWGRSVYDIREARDLPFARAAQRVILTHLSHDIDTAAVKLPAGWGFAYDGLEVVL